MKKLYHISAKWRKRDIDYFRNLGLDKRIETGYDSFTIDSQELFEEIKNHFTKRSSIFFLDRPKNFMALPATAEFTKLELDKAEFFVLRAYSGDSMGMPQPHKSYNEDTFDFDCPNCFTGRKQKRDFQIDEPRLRKHQMSFTLVHFDFCFYRKEFYNEHLKPWGLKCREVINYKNGKISDRFIQLIIPEANSFLDIQGGEFNELAVCHVCGGRQYPFQILDFFPSFKDNFDFAICRTREEFVGGNRRLVVSKDFCEFLVHHKIIKYNQNQLVPVRV